MVISKLCITKFITKFIFNKLLLHFNGYHYGGIFVVRSDDLIQKFKYSNFDQNYSSVSKSFLVVPT